jgi:hypothetical protein
MAPDADRWAAFVHGHEEQTAAVLGVAPTIPIIDILVATR